MRRAVLAGVMALALVVLVPGPVVSAAPSPVLTAYKVTCTGVGGPYGTPAMLPEPRSSTYQVPDVSSAGPGAFVARVQLVDNFLRSRFVERPAGVIEADEGALWTAASVCVAVPNQLPVGELLITKVEGRGVGIFGYAYDPDSSAVVSVRATVDGRMRPQRFPADWRWTASPNWSSRANDRGVLVLLDGLDTGEHRVCLTAEDGVGGTDLVGMKGLTATLGCVQVVVK